MKITLANRGLPYLSEVNLILEMLYSEIKLSSVTQSTSSETIYFCISERVSLSTCFPPNAFLSVYIDEIPNAHSGKISFSITSL